MKYYVLEYSTNKREVGTYPQTDGYYPNYDINGLNSLVNLDSEKLPIFIPDLRFELDKRAKITDILKVGNISRANGLFVNQRTKDLIMNLKLPLSAFYEGFVEKKASRLNYFWLHLVDQSLGNIDFQKSIFYTTILGFIKDSQIKIQNELDLKNKCESLGKLILAEKIVLTEDFIMNKYDIFQFPLIQKSNTFFISDKFERILIENKITGVEIKEQTMITEIN